MKLYRVAPTTESLDLDTPAATDTLRDWFRPAPGWTWALVSTPGGDTIDADGASRALSNPVDRAVLTSMRNQSEAVVLGGATLRAENVPVPTSGPLVVVSRSGDLRDHRIPEKSLRPDSVWVVTPEGLSHDPTEFFPEGVAIHLTTPGTDGVDAVSVRDVLASRGVTQVLLEAGRDLAGQCLDAGIVHSLTLTLTGAPRSETHPPLPWWKDEWGEWSAADVFTDDMRYLYLRYHQVHVDSV